MIILTSNVKTTDINDINTHPGRGNDKTAKCVPRHFSLPRPSQNSSGCQGDVARHMSSTDEDREKLSKRAPAHGMVRQVSPLVVFSDIGGIFLS